MAGIADDFFADLVPVPGRDEKKASSSGPYGEDAVLPATADAQAASSQPRDGAVTPPALGPAGPALKPMGDARSRKEAKVEQSTQAFIESALKGFAGGLQKVLEDISRRLQALENQAESLGRSQADFKDLLGVREDALTERLNGLEKSLREVHRNVQLVRDKQELLDAQATLSKLAIKQSAPVASPPASEAVSAGEALAPAPAAPPSAPSPVPPSAPRPAPGPEAPAPALGLPQLAAIVTPSAAPPDAPQMQAPSPAPSAAAPMPPQAPQYSQPAAPPPPVQEPQRQPSAQLPAPAPPMPQAPPGSQWFPTGPPHHASTAPQPLPQAHLGLQHAFASSAPSYQPTPVAQAPPPPLPQAQAPTPEAPPLMPPALPPPGWQPPPPHHGGYGGMPPPPAGPPPPSMPQQNLGPQGPPPPPSYLAPPLPPQQYAPGRMNTQQSQGYPTVAPPPPQQQYPSSSYPPPSFPARHSAQQGRPPQSTGYGGRSGSMPPLPPQSGGAPSGMAARSMPLEQVIDDVANMGFSRADVRGVVTDLMDKGQSVDMNVILDRLMNGRR